MAVNHLLLKNLRSRVRSFGMYGVVGDCVGTSVMNLLLAQSLATLVANMARRFRSTSWRPNSVSLQFSPSISIHVNALSFSRETTICAGEKRYRSCSEYTSMPSGVLKAARNNTLSTELSSPNHFTVAIRASGKAVVA